mmetsp:Transcript_817/g.2326  ORF Transcript_817/g.2326 Transcript_817/m.2326 type:complete len:92 (+) Transcript_817:178-453(+)
MIDAGENGEPTDARACTSRHAPRLRMHEGRDAPGLAMHDIAVERIRCPAFGRSGALDSFGIRLAANFFARRNYTIMYAEMHEAPPTKRTDG